MFCATCSRTNLQERCEAHSMDPIQRSYFQSRNTDGGAWIQPALQKRAKLSRLVARHVLAILHPRFHRMSPGRSCPGTRDDASTSRFAGSSCTVQTLDSTYDPGVRFGRRDGIRSWRTSVPCPIRSERGTGRGLEWVATRSLRNIEPFPPLLSVPGPIQPRNEEEGGIRCPATTSRSRSDYPPSLRFV